MCCNIQTPDTLITCFASLICRKYGSIKSVNIVNTMTLILSNTESVQSTQKELIRKHQEAKSRVNYVSGVGGGVSLWPAMDDMRLSCNEMIMLLVSSLSLMLISGGIFLFVHGQ